MFIPPCYISDVISGLLGRLFLARDGTLRALAGTRVVLGVLSADRQAATMTDAAVAADFHQTLDVHGNLAAEVAFHLHMVLDVFTKLADFVFGKVLSLEEATPMP